MSKTIRIKLCKLSDNSYDIIIGKILATIAREIVRGNESSKYFIITDSNVKRLYGDEFLKTLRSHELEVHLLSVPAGEKSKTRKIKEQLEDKLIELKADRYSLIIALGGGMIGDLAGYVAATLLRGIPFIQIPTTLLSQVDSSVGGKVAVNHPSGKNLIGAFYQPTKVYVDVNTLKTLPEREFRNGMAEVIKYAAILDKDLFSFTERNHSKIILNHQSSTIHLIHHCCELKKSIIEKDEKETSLRRILNFGHTIGHAVEFLSNYRLSHGEALAIGMVAESKISSSLGLLNRSDVERLSSLLKLYKLPIEIPSRMNIIDIVDLTSHDKKVRRGKVQYTLLERIGKARVGVEISPEKVIHILSI